MTAHFDFWKGKRVLLTGHTGFKGCWLSLWLQSMGAQLVGYALAPPTKPSLFEVANVGQGMTSIIGDVRDLNYLQSTIAEHKPEIFFHLAAQPLVRYSYVDPVETYSTNVMGTVNILEAVRKVGGVKAVVNITSDKCYENKEWAWGYRENEPMGGYDPYSNSKGCSELVTSAFRNSFFNPADYLKHRVALASARAGNVIGGGDWAADRLIPDILRAIELGKPVVIRNPGAIRPWQHVLEPLCGYLQLAQKLYEDGPSYSGAWNFGPDDSDAKPVFWIVENMTRLWEGASWVLDGAAHPHEARYLKLDSSKSRSLLGWRPGWNLTTAIGAIVDWQQAFLLREDMREKSLSTIRNYLSSKKFS
jgi:CDP-glucose 4,6-dehydratase